MWDVFSRCMRNGLGIDTRRWGRLPDERQTNESMFSRAHSMSIAIIVSP